MGWRATPNREGPSDETAKTRLTTGPWMRLLIPTVLRRESGRITFTHWTMQAGEAAVKTCKNGDHGVRARRSTSRSWIERFNFEYVAMLGLCGIDHALRPVADGWR